MESGTTNVTVAELCRSLNPNVLYNWNFFIEGDRMALSGSG